MNRDNALEALQSATFDLLVIGGGITGAGIALDAAARGLTVALIDMHDFAAGTSSRSTKLIHGGLRYLKQLEFKLVNEVGRERAIVHKLAPHLVHPDKMLLPLVKDGNYGYWLTSMGLSVYDYLAGVEGDDRRRMLSREETLAAEPLLRAETIEGGGLYAEYRTDDARLVISVIKTAVGFGATAANYIKAEELLIGDRKIAGVRACDLRSNERFTIQARMVVNATGPWVDDIRRYEGEVSGKHLRLTKGVHLVVDRERLPVKQTVYFDNDDRRMIFAVPRGKTTYLGTTDTEYTGDKREPDVLKEDVDYILNAVNRMFPTVKLTRNDVESTWAGLRPLIHEEGKRASDVSRKDEIFVSSNGLISIAGGKLTGYRKMAERVVDKVIEKLGISKAPCDTDAITLFGGDFDSYQAVRDFRNDLDHAYPEVFTTRNDASYLVYNYGRDAKSIAEHAHALGGKLEALLKAELLYTVEHEMVMTTLDFLERRTGRLNFDFATAQTSAEYIVNELGNLLGWSIKQKTDELSTVYATLNRVSGVGTWRAARG